MKRCSSCEHTQEVGNFCGKCGAPLIDSNAVPSQEAHTEAASTIEPNQVPPARNVQPNEQIENIKVESKKYFNYFISQLKEPSAAEDDGAASFKNGLITVISYIILTAIAIYTSIQVTIPRGFGFESLAPSIFQMIISLGVFFALIFVVNITSIFVTSKLFSTNLTFQETFNKISKYYVVPSALSVVAIVLGILKSLGATTFVIITGFSIAFGIIPIFVMVKLLANESKGIDRFYAFIFYLLFNIVIVVIAMILIADSMVGEMLEYIL